MAGASPKRPLNLEDHASAAFNKVGGKRTFAAHSTNGRVADKADIRPWLFTFGERDNFTFAKSTVPDLITIDFFFR